MQLLGLRRFQILGYRLLHGRISVRSVPIGLLKELLKI